MLLECVFLSRPPQMTEFHALHRELVPYVAFVKTLDLPSVSKSIFGRSSSSNSGRVALERDRMAVQKYLDAILSDDQERPLQQQ